MIRSVRQSSLRMGNGIHRAIHEERWDDVRSMLQQEQVQKWFPSKWYFALESTSKYPNENDSDNSSSGKGSNSNSRSRNNSKNKKEKVVALHLLLQYNVPVDIVETVVNLEPRLLQIQSSHGKHLPLHFVLLNKKRRSASRQEEIVDLLLQRYPAAVAVTNAFGQTPLHIAYKVKSSLRIMKTLCRLHPKAVSIHDNQGLTPWDALRGKTSVLRINYRREARRILNHDYDGDDANDSADETADNMTASEMFPSKINFEIALRRKPPIQIPSNITQRQVIPYRRTASEKARAKRRLRRELSKQQQRSQSNSSSTSTIGIVNEVLQHATNVSFWGGTKNNTRNDDQQQQHHHHQVRQGVPFYQKASRIAFLVYAIALAVSFFVAIIATMT